MRKYFAFLLIILLCQMGCENYNPDIMDLVSGFDILSQGFKTLPESELYFVQNGKTVKEMKVIKDSEKFHSEVKFCFDDNQNLIERSSVSDEVPIEIKYVYEDGILKRRDYYVNGELLKKSSYEINVIEKTNKFINLEVYRLDNEEIYFTLSAELDVKKRTIHWYKKGKKDWSNIIISYNDNWIIAGIYDKTELFDDVSDKEISFLYNNDGKISEYSLNKITVDSKHLYKYFYVAGSVSEIKYFLNEKLRTRDLITEYDDKGNWTKRIANPDGNTIIITRDIDYY